MPDPAPAASVPVVRVVDPDNPRNPYEDTKKLYLWAPSRGGHITNDKLITDGYSFASVREDNDNYPGSSEWWRKEISPAAVVDKSDPQLPQEDKDDLFQWAAVPQESDVMQKLVIEQGFSFVSNYTCSDDQAVQPTHLYRKRRATNKGVKRARSLADEDNGYGATF